MGTYIKELSERQALAASIDDLVNRAEFLNFSEIGLGTQWDARAKGEVKWDDYVLIERFRVKCLPIIQELESTEKILEEQIYESFKALAAQKAQLLACGPGQQKNELRVEYYKNHDWLIKLLEQLQACKKYLLACSQTCEKALTVITTLMAGKNEDSFPVELRPYIDYRWTKRKSKEAYALGGIKQYFRDTDGFIRHDIDADNVQELLKEYGIEFKFGKMEHQSGVL